MNNVFYRPNMIQWSSRPVFKGRDMQEDYLKKIKEKINVNTIPEVGEFAPVAAEFKLENNERAAFCVNPGAAGRKAKSLTISHLGSDLVVASQMKEFPDKAKLLAYIDSLDDSYIEKEISDLKDSKKQ